MKVPGVNVRQIVTDATAKLWRTCRDTCDVIENDGLARDNGDDPSRPGCGAYSNNSDMNGTGVERDDTRDIIGLREDCLALKVLERVGLYLKKKAS